MAKSSAISETMMDLEQSRDRSVPSIQENSALKPGTQPAGSGRHRKWWFSGIVLIVVIVSLVISLMVVFIDRNDSSNTQGDALNATHDNDEQEDPATNVTIDSPVDEGSGDTGSEDDDEEEYSDEFIRQAMRDMQGTFHTKSCRGASVLAVTRNSGIHVITAHGDVKDLLRDIDESPTSPVDKHSLFEIGSLSKPLTGLVLAHQLVLSSHKGETQGQGNPLTLDTTLNSLLPDSIPTLVGVWNESVTFRDLVTHTAGFPRLSQNVLDRLLSDAFNALRESPYEGYSEDDLLEQIRQTATQGLSQTGEFEYSNFGFAILAYLLSAHAGNDMDFSDLQWNLAQELNMTETYLGSTNLPPDVAQSRLTTGYHVPRAFAAPYWYNSGIFLDGAGTTLSSANDMLYWLEALLKVSGTNANKTTDDNESDLLEESLRLSITPLWEGSSFGLAFGWIYAYWNSTSTDTILYEHNGGTAGFSSYAAFQPKSQVGIVGLTNCGNNREIDAMGRELATMLFQE